jgi:signal transduction histidine kinase
MPSDPEQTRDLEPAARGTPPGTRPDRQSLLDQLREANEQLVVSSMRAQDLADQADASRAEAETASRLKDEFLAVVSHELRTPLNAILGWARLLDEGQLDPSRTTEAIHTIERNAQALGRIIDDLLDISRMIGGRAAIESRAIDLVSVIEGALDGVRPAADTSRWVPGARRKAGRTGGARGGGGHASRAVERMIRDSHSRGPPAPPRPALISLLTWWWHARAAGAARSRNRAPRLSLEGVVATVGGHRALSPRRSNPGDKRLSRPTRAFEFAWSHHCVRLRLERCGRWVGGYQDEGHVARRASAPVADPRSDILDRFPSHSALRPQ